MKTAIVLGTFDGLHAGHCAVIEKALDFYGIAVTFDIPPKCAISGKSELLILPDDRARRIKELGIKQVEMQSFDVIKNVPARQYLEDLKVKYNPSRIVCGYNYRFGYKAEGDTALLESFCKENEIAFICVPCVEQNGIALSSTYIRGLVRDGKMLEASKAIYGGFSFTAPVVHGDCRGRHIGFPTANQNYPSELVKPRFGVYISCVIIDGKKYDAITNIGIRPTFQTETVGCETYIKDFSGDIYGKEIKTELISFVRDEKRFDSLDELTAAIKNDVSLLS